MFRILTAAEKGRPGAWVLTVGHEPPMSIVIGARLTQRLLEMPEGSLLPPTAIQAAALKITESLLQDYRGVDLDTTIIVQPTNFEVETEQGALVRFPVIAFWNYGITTLLHSGYVRLSENYFAELQLLRAELFHRYGGGDD